MNLPGWLFSSAILQASAHTVVVIFGFMNAFTGAPAASLSRYEKTRCCSAVIVRVLHDQGLRFGQLAHVGARSVGLLGDADILRVVGHPHEIQRRLDLDVVAERMLDYLALRILEGLIGPGDAVAHDPCVHRPTGVDVGLAEVGVALGIRLAERRQCCRKAKSHECGFKIHRAFSFSGFQPCKFSFWIYVFTSGVFRSLNHARASRIVRTAWTATAGHNSFPAHWPPRPR